MLRAAGPSAWAPGRVNLIGEHTDYNDGFVLPIAIDRGVSIAFAPRADRIIRAVSSLDGATHDIALDALDAQRGAGWAAYVAGVAWAMVRAGHTLRGADLRINSTIQNGAGLSSSAALEIATYRALAEVAGIAWDGPAAAKIARHAENQFVGVACGVMDQMASACARKGQTMLLDCRSLQPEFVPMPANAVVVVLDTGVRRRLATSDYNERRTSCERALVQICRTKTGVLALRDVTTPEINAMLHTLGAVEWQRASHVVAENARVISAVEAMLSGDMVTLGRLFTASHESLRDLYEVSSRELDAIVEWAIDQPGCHGARMTGAGFGGCAIALVSTAHAEDFVRNARPALRDVVPQLGEVFTVSASAGATLESRDR